MFKVSQRNLVWYCPKNKKKSVEFIYSLVSMCVRCDSMLFIFMTLLLTYHLSPFSWVHFFFLLNYLLPNFGSYFPMLSSDSLLVSPCFNKTYWTVFVVVSCSCFTCRNFLGKLQQPTGKLSVALAPKFKVL